jgi:hypothetical protein
VTIDIASIDAWLVGGRDKPKILQDGVDVTLPETMGFGVALKGSLNREDVSVRYRRASEVCSPPVLKDMVDAHVESLRRGRIFCEGITDIGTVDALVLDGAKSEEEAQAGLFHAGCVGVVKSTNLATTSRTVTDVTGLFRLGFVGLDVVCPHPIEDGGIGRSGDRVSEHTLLGRMVKLLILARFPFRPVSSTGEISSCEFAGRW